MLSSNSGPLMWNTQKGNCRRVKLIKVVLCPDSIIQIRPITAQSGYRYVTETTGQRDISAGDIERVT